MLITANTETTGWSSAIRGMRNPMNSWAKSDSKRELDPTDDESLYIYVRETPSSEYWISMGDAELMMRLRNAGSDHRKFMRMIKVYTDITAPLYWWKEFDTYKVGTVANSCSTMHKIQDNEFTMADFSHEHLFADTLISGRFQNSRRLLEDTIYALNAYRYMYNTINTLLKDSNMPANKRNDLVEEQKDIWWQMIQLLPSSYNQTRTVELNYEVLANMYAARKNHKLDEWHTLCHWMEQLPFAALIVGHDPEEA